MEMLKYTVMALSSSAHVEATLIAAIGAKAQPAELCAQKLGSYRYAVH